MSDLPSTIRELVERGDYVQALQELDPYLIENPECPAGLFLFGQIMLSTDKPYIAYLAYEKVAKLEPNRTEVWCNLGKAAGDLNRFKEEERCFKKALKLDPNNQVAMKNLAANGVHQHKPEQAIHWARKALKLGEDQDARHNLGFALLLQHKWEGWKEYEYGLGTVPSRQERNYQGEPRWNGEPNKNVVIYGEQGLGDQIAFAAPILGAKNDVNVILDVHRKLEGLFKRSFRVPTFGTFRETELEWVSRYRVDANCSLASLQKHYRGSDEDFTGEPFLVPDPVRRKAWKAILDGDKPKIGIAWTGGTAQTQGVDRSTSLDMFSEFMDDRFTWVSLEYTDKADEIRAFNSFSGVEVLNFPWATQTDDYDDTAALVSELDLVIAVPTSVVHLAGGLGVPCWCITPKHPSFMFGMKGRTIPFYNSVELFRRSEGWDVLTEIKERLNGLYSGYPGRAGTSRGVQTCGGISPHSHLSQGAVLQDQHKDC